MAVFSSVPLVLLHMSNDRLTFNATYRCKQTSTAAQISSENLSNYPTAVPPNTHCKQHSQIRCCVNSLISPEYFRRVSKFAKSYCNLRHVCLSVCLSVCLTICLTICLSICLSVCLSIYPSIHPSIHPSIYLSVRPSILSTPYRPAQYAVLPLMWYAAVLSYVAPLVRI